VNFDSNEEGIVKLFNEFDRYQLRATTAQATPDEACVFRLAELEPQGPYQTANFQLVSALVQMPHLDVEKEIAKRAGRPLTEVELRHLRQRIASAKLWVEQYASEEEKTHLQPTLPGRAHTLSETQRAFLHLLADALPETPWSDDALQAKVFEIARLTPIEQPVAFKAIYRVLLDREAGPKAGNLLAFLDVGFVVPRFRELPVDRLVFWRESAITPADLEKWLEKERAKIAAQTWTTDMTGNIAVFEITYTMTDGKKHLKRLLVEGQAAEDSVRGLLARLPTSPPTGAC
jgi:lysyl-tRNA synthetase, class I